MKKIYKGFSALKIDGVFSERFSYLKYVYYTLLNVGDLEDIYIVNIAKKYRRTYLDYKSTL